MKRPAVVRNLPDLIGESAGHVPWSMLATYPMMAFVPVGALGPAIDFYRDVLGLALTHSVPDVVAVFDAGGTSLRVTVVPDHSPAQGTVVGWDVPNLEAAIASATAAGVAMLQFDGMTDARGIWLTPGGDRVAWFHDPDTNTLSITEFARKPIAAARNIAPVFPVRSVPDSLGRYSQLGFTTEIFDPTSTSPPYGFARRNNVQLHVSRVDDLDPTTSMSAAYLYVNDADALHTEWSASGVSGHFHPPVDTDYGIREGAYVDPDGNLIRYGSFR